MFTLFLLPWLQAGVKHVILAVSYRAEMLENEMREQEAKVSGRDKEEGDFNGSGKREKGKGVWQSSAQLMPYLFKNECMWKFA